MSHNYSNWDFTNVHKSFVVKEDHKAKGNKRGQTHSGKYKNSYICSNLYLTILTNNQLLVLNFDRTSRFSRSYIDTTSHSQSHDQNLRHASPTDNQHTLATLSKNEKVSLQTNVTLLERYIFTLCNHLYICILFSDQNFSPL